MFRVSEDSCLRVSHFAVPWAYINLALLTRDEASYLIVLAIPQDLLISFTSFSSSLLIPLVLLAVFGWWLVSCWIKVFFRISISFLFLLNCYMFSLRLSFTHTHTTKSSLSQTIIHFFVFHSCITRVICLIYMSFLHISLFQYTIICASMYWSSVSFLLCFFIYFR